MRRLELLNLTLLVALLAFAVWAWPQLPDRIPTHFNARGAADAWSARTFWAWYLLPAIALFMTLVLHFSARVVATKAKYVNLPSKAQFMALPPEEQEPILRELQRFVLAVNTLLLVIFGSIQWATYSTALGRPVRSLMIWVLVLSVVVAPLLSLVVMVRSSTAINAAYRRARMRGTLRVMILLFAGASSACAPGATVPGPASRPAAALADTLRQLTAGFQGEVGIYVRHLGNGQTVALAADDTFPTASMIKLPLLVALHARAAAGALHLDSLYALADSSVLQSDGEDLVAQLRWGEKVHLRKLAFLMMATSDNTASVWIQDLIGGSDTANAWLERNGFAVTRDNSRLPHRREIWLRWGWGMTTPREMAELLAMVREGRAVSAAASASMYRLMKGSYWSDEALSAIPPWVGVASKQGAVNRSRSEVLLVESPSGPYVLAVITKNQQDESWRTDNAGYVLLRRVSGAVWRHFQ